MNAYIEDIKAQAATLRMAVNRFDGKGLQEIHNAMKSGAIDRIILSGMGASLNAAYPAYLALNQGNLPVNLVNTAELLNYLQASISAHSLLWLNSQSGRSIETVRLLEGIRHHAPRVVLACVNEAESPLALAAGITLPIHAGEEATVSVKTYSNMLAVNLLAAYTLLGWDVEQLRNEMLDTVELMEAYLQDWDNQLARLEKLTSDVSSLVFTGRGSSLAAVWSSALISKEAAKCAFEGMHAAEFRHGPLELCQPGFVAVIFAGPEETRAQNRDLAGDVLKYGGKVVWVSEQKDPDLPSFMLPDVSAHTRPLVEILVGQMLSVVLARRKGIEPGYFRYVGKVTLKE